MIEYFTLGAICLLLIAEITLIITLHKVDKTMTKLNKNIENYFGSVFKKIDMIVSKLDKLGRMAVEQYLSGTDNGQLDITLGKMKGHLKIGRKK